MTQKAETKKADKKERKAGRSEKFTTPVGRIASMPHLREADMEGEIADGKRKVRLMFAKSRDLSVFHKAAEQAAKDLWGPDVDMKTVQVLIRDGDKKAAQDPEKFGHYAGQNYATFKTQFEVGLVGPDKKPLADDAKLYAGAWGRCSATANAYVTKREVELADGTIEEREVKSISFYLINFQKIRDDVPFYGGGDPSADFEEDYDDVVGGESLSEDDIPF